MPAGRRLVRGSLRPFGASSSSLVGLDGIEPSTSRLSGVRSNRSELQAPECQHVHHGMPLSQTSPSRRPPWNSGPTALHRAHARAPMLDLSKLNSGGCGSDQGVAACGSNLASCILRKEVIQPQVPLRLPCYDFTPIIGHTFGAYLPGKGLVRRLLVQPTLMV